MPVFLIPLLNAFASCKICRAVVVGLAAFAALSTALGVYTLHVKHKAVAAYVAVQEKATAAESVRRQAVIAASQAKAEAASARSITLEKRNASLKAQLARATVRTDGNSCLDIDIVRRVRELGQPPGR